MPYNSAIINHKDKIFWIQTLEGKDVLPQCKKKKPSFFNMLPASSSGYHDHLDHDTLMKTDENVGEDKG